MTHAEWKAWYQSQGEVRVPLTCPLCKGRYESGEIHTCSLPVAERITRAQRQKREVHFTDPNEVRQVIQFFTERCHRDLHVPEDVTEIKGRFHFNLGYFWSYRKGWKWTSFASFAEK